MFDVAPSELLLLGAVALIVIPPKDLPKAMRVAGYWVGKARGVARQFRAGFDDMIRDAELKEMDARGAAENDRIMREHPTSTLLTHEALAEASAAEPSVASAAEGPPVMVAKPRIAPTPPDTPTPARASVEPGEAL